MKRAPILQQIFNKIVSKTGAFLRTLSWPAFGPVMEATMHEPTFEHDDLIDLGAASELTQGAEAQEVEQLVLIKRELE